MTLAAIPLREKLSLPNGRGQQLAALLDRPAEGPILAYVLYAHCFTCTHEIITATRLGRALAERGLAVLRFSFTGLGHSEGHFTDTNLGTNIADLVATADFMRAQMQAPTVLVGHSLGGVAALMAAPKLESVRTVITLGAPAETTHMRYLLRDSLEQIMREGQATVEIGGQRHTISRQFIEDLDRHELAISLRQLQRPLLILHGSADELIAPEHATRLYEAAAEPRQLDIIEGGDHLLSKQLHAQMAADMMVKWVARHL